MLVFFRTAFVWTTHPTLPLGFVPSNNMFKTKAECVAAKEKSETEYMASVGNHIMANSKPPIRVNKVYRIVCMTSTEITKLNTLLGHK